ncbi:MAG: hypothetical protein H6P95_2103 [Candidatus Aminicenantes bacterium]|nr:hypothetical protein [Candidatus Aminicenantes bacterium]
MIDDQNPIYKTGRLTGLRPGANVLNPETTMSGVYDLIDKAARSAKVVVRDDQNEWNEILDAVKAARSRRRRINLLDTGRFSAVELEWLCEAGARFFTSDEVRRDAGDLRRIQEACARGGSAIAFLVTGPVDVPSLLELARLKIILHISNRERAVDPAALAALAAEGRLVYYHHGPLAPELAEAAGLGIRLHLSDGSLDAGDPEPALGILAASRSGRGRVYVYVEKGLPPEFLRDIASAGARLLFKTPPSDSQSRLRPIERRFAKTAPAPEDHYLDATFLI